MASAVCTLFEGSYHHGLAALANSLHRAGFKGRLFAGHRGPRPAWAAASPQFALPDGPEIVFLPLDTSHHLTNVKPAFMLSLLDGPARDVDALFYIDPDICVAQRWGYFDDWAGCGVALCEDLNSPLAEFHPRRVGWRRHYGTRGLPLRYRVPQYVNAGFVGVRAQDREFLETWQRAMLLMADEIGGLGAAKVAGGQALRGTGFADCFDCSDQDALNAAIEATTLPLSIVGQDAMAFRPGAALLPHAVGANKPWQRNYLRAALGGVAPRTADKAFWAHAQAPIETFGALHRFVKRLDLRSAAAIGRLVRRA